MFFNQRLLILTYHRVLTAPDPLRPGQTDVAMFEKHAENLSANFNVLSLEDAVDRIKEGTLPGRAVVITFDDGYSDNAAIALPILQKNNLTATFFVATGFIDGGRMWNDTLIEAIRACPRDELDLRAFDLDRWCLTTTEDRRETIRKLIERLKYLDLATRYDHTERIASAVGVELPNDLMMTSEQIRTLAECGMSIGAHTVNHPILARIGTADAVQEVEKSRDRLESIVGRVPDSFAYPNGRPDSDYKELHVDIVRKAGFRVAVTTANGCVTGKCDFLQLPRIVSWDRTSFRFAARLLKAYFAGEGERAKQTQL